MSKIETILCDTILERLLHRTDNNATRNYLIGSIEYCLMSSSKMGGFNEEENDDRKHQSESIGLINNRSFMPSFITVFLQHSKSISRTGWIVSNKVLMVLLLRMIVLFFAGVKSTTRSFIFGNFVTAILLQNIQFFVPRSANRANEHQKIKARNVLITPTSSLVVIVQQLLNKQ